MSNLLQNSTMLLKMKYGSHLYGTSTPSSDVDYKVLYLPSIDLVLMGHRIANFKTRFNADGTIITDHKAPMPPNGWEIEYIALQTFLSDYFAGQTYAVEMLYGLFANNPTAFGLKEGESSFSTNLQAAMELARPDYSEWDILSHSSQYLEMDRLYELLSNVLCDLRSFQTYNVASLVGFAMKQTFDYVNRGERKREVQYFLDTLNRAADAALHLHTDESRALRLDSPVAVGAGNDGYTVFRIYDMIEAEVKNGEYAEAIKPTMTLNGTRNERSFTFAGRQYVETTPISELRRILQTRIDSYGVRSSDAAENTIEPKSMMHAVRVYQQAIQLLEDGRITFPRPNVEELLDIKHLITSTDEVVAMLQNLDEKVKEAQKAQPPKTDMFREEFGRFKLRALRKFYRLK